MITTSSGTNGNLVEAADRGNAVDLGMMRIHQAEFALEFRLAILPRMARPTEPWRGLAPTSATERGDSRFFRR